jgi:hypothetical protein
MDRYKKIKAKTRHYKERQYVGNTRTQTNVSKSKKKKG